MKSLKVIALGLAVGLIEKAKNVTAKAEHDAEIVEMLAIKVAKSEGTVVISLAEGNVSTIRVRVKEDQAVNLLGYALESALKNIDDKTQLEKHINGIQMVLDNFKPAVIVERNDTPITQLDESTTFEEDEATFEEDL